MGRWHYQMLFFPACCSVPAKAAGRGGAQSCVHAPSSTFSFGASLVPLCFEAVLCTVQPDLWTSCPCFNCFSHPPFTKFCHLLIVKLFIYDTIFKWVKSLLWLPVFVTTRLQSFLGFVCLPQFCFSHNPYYIWCATLQNSVFRNVYCMTAEMPIITFQRTLTWLSLGHIFFLDQPLGFI